jgi:diaminopropionate ammonia-lyase
MGGLRCGEVSRSAFAAVQSIVDGFIAIEDEWAFEAMRLLAAPRGGDPPLEIGPSGAAATGGVLAALRDPSGAEIRERLGLGPSTRVLTIASEGVTEPDLFARIVRR